MRRAQNGRHVEKSDLPTSAGKQGGGGAETDFAEASTTGRAQLPIVAECVSEFAGKSLAGKKMPFGPLAGPHAIGKDFFVQLLRFVSLLQGNFIILH